MTEAPLYEIRLGNALSVLKELEAESVHACCTSPPYWSLRCYGLAPSLWPDGWEGCLGLEPTPAMFISHIVALSLGRRFIGIEMQEAYLPLIAERLARYEGLGLAPEEAKIKGPRTLSLGI